MASDFVFLNRNRLGVYFLLFQTSKKNSEEVICLVLNIFIFFLLEATVVILVDQPDKLEPLRNKVLDKVYTKITSCMLLCENFQILANPQKIDTPEVHPDNK
jgi:hypothetical protein